MSSSSSDGGSSSSDSDSAKVEAPAESEPAQQTAKRKTEDAGVSSDSGSDDDGDGSDSSESEESSKKKKKKKKAKDKKKKDKKKDKKAKKKGKKAKKGKDKKAKNKKGSKKDKKKKGKNLKEAVSMQFGKYGVIKAEDFYNKKAEFLVWAMEVKKENTDVMGQMEMKNLFKEYIEDYNTATMPSKKYYNLQAWDAMQSKKQAAKKRGDDMSEALKSALASFDDEKARREEIKHLQAKKQEEMITSEVRKMKADKEKVSTMQSQARLKTQIEMLHKAGHSADAEKLAARLKG